ncbi:NUDIX hydrolase domain-like protein [Schizophyllum amplum]|uniref:Oxidized purine nucleoside triphosphate hydrolase n=1 Tax=Schizophyllum amplum TaxID=97359 RepID=A0A550C6C3_9AGAR|nr:NUDIX hydrolase domain-like protein [Auriculariopsis ampla]
MSYNDLPDSTRTLFPPGGWKECAVGGIEYPWMDLGPLKGYTNAFIVRYGKILLGMKKRGFGVGKINGFGGKVDPGETSLEAAVREMEEEAGIRAPLTWAGMLIFVLQGQEKVFHCDVYRAESFEGEVIETDEMRPAWYAVSDIPYPQMWADDPYWLPLLVAGVPFVGRADFGKDEAGEFVMRRWWVGKQA